LVGFVINKNPYNFTNYFSFYLAILLATNQIFTMKREITDRRATQVADQILLGNIQKFEGIFDIIPKTVVALALGTNANRITRLIDDPEDIVYKDLVKLSKFINVPLVILSKLVVNAILLKQGKEIIPIKAAYKKKYKIQEELNFINPIKE
jgi:hypothetical protein